MKTCRFSETQILGILKQVEGGLPVSKLLNVLYDFNREGLAIDVDFSLPAERVIRSLNQIIEWRGKPASITNITAMTINA